MPEVSGKRGPVGIRMAYIEGGILEKGEQRGQDEARRGEEMVKLWRLRAGRRFVASRSPIEAYSRDQQITSFVSDARTIFPINSRMLFWLLPCCLDVGRLGGDESGEGWAVLWYHRIHTAYTERRDPPRETGSLGSFLQRRVGDGGLTAAVLRTNAELRLLEILREISLAKKKHQDDLEMPSSHTRTHTHSHSAPGGTHLHRCIFKLSILALSPDFLPQTLDFGDRTKADLSGSPLE
ncbi:uncharacterized protein CLUP02_16615 [Colletotrichum lupini]|uniref:Uncharacterized protein n=1 Tax=Colletotrichum lupini TaxID=145971 RepID=A0A9Q8T887_9PEZI|nr:uncharacterized protein CLUP02_16615 [Colletotrichum lupini]UQC91081.1 hypothetical protein CLUP02_16615 [Colletotrichum lupini]